MYAKSNQTRHQESVKITHSQQAIDWWVKQNHQYASASSWIFYFGGKSLESPPRNCRILSDGQKRMEKNSRKNNKNKQARTGRYFLIDQWEIRTETGKTHTQTVCNGGPCLATRTYRSITIEHRIRWIHVNKCPVRFDFDWSKPETLSCVPHDSRLVG